MAEKLIRRAALDKVVDGVGVVRCAHGRIGDRVIGLHAEPDHEVAERDSREYVLGHRPGAAARIFCLGFIHAGILTRSPAESIA